MASQELVTLRDPMNLDKRSASSGHFELVLDGNVSTAYLRSVEGGHMRTKPIDEPIGPENIHIKHSSVAEIEPFSIEMGLAGSGDVLRWIQASWRKEFNRRNGQITHANFDLQRTFEHEFSDALIEETTFPALDTTSKDAAYLKVKVQPERVVSRKGGSGQLGGTLTDKHKLWTPAAFRFNIDGIDEARFTSKIEQLTIKQGIKKFYTGEDRLPQIEPTKIEFPNIVGSISLEYADKLLEWYDEYVVKGMTDTRAQKTGSIEFLSPDRKRTLFEITLDEMGIVHAQIVQAKGNEPQLKRLQFEIYVGRMDIQGSLGLA
jgi:hypothetical protein